MCLFGCLQHFVSFVTDLIIRLLLYMLVFIAVCLIEILQLIR